MAESQSQGFFINMIKAGVSGESQKTSHPGSQGWMEAASWNFSMHQSADHSVGQSAGTGTAAVGTFSFDRIFDKSSPLLLKACSLGQHIDSITFEAERSGLGGTQGVSGLAGSTAPSGNGNTAVYLQLVFTNVVVTNRSVAFSGEDRGSESLSFAFAQVQMTHRQVLTTGTIGAQTTKMYDAKMNKAG